MRDSWVADWFSIAVPDSGIYPDTEESDIQLYSTEIASMMGRSRSMQGSRSMQVGKVKRRLLVCGSRRWQDFQTIRKVLEYCWAAGYRRLCHGDAIGADRIGGLLAKRIGYKVTVFPADWDTHGKAAGRIRNQRMLDEFQPDLVIAFRSPGASNGTDHMVSIAQAMGITTLIKGRK